MTKTRWLVLPTAALLLAGCLGPQPEPPDSPARIENVELGLAIAALPEPFEVSVNQGKELVLVAPGPARLQIAVAPEQRTGINLVRQVQERQAIFEAEGTYFGNRELMTPIGTAFTARGAYEKDGVEVEETWVYSIHPHANRLLTVTYTYPPGESEKRIAELVAVLGELEGIGFRE